MPNRYMNLPGQEPISETYQNIEAGFDAVQEDVDAAVGVSEGIQAEVTEHKDSTAAHAAEHITYSGNVAGVTNLKDAVDNVQEQFNTVVVSGDSSPAADQARISSTGTTYPTLKSRLDTERDGLAAQLAEKAPQTGLDATNNTVALKANQSALDITNNDLAETKSRVTVQENKKISQTDITPELLAQITGTAPVNATPADYSVTPRKMNYPTVKGIASKNLFDKTDITAGFYVNYSTGALVTSATYSVSNYIPIEPNTSYAVSGGTHQLAFYDAGKTFISGVQVPSVVTSPSGAYWVRLSVLNTSIDIKQIEKGTAATSYESFTAKIDSSLLKKRSVLTEHIEEGQVTLDRLSFHPTVGVPSVNLFDRTTVTPGRYPNYQHGGLSVAAGKNASDYIVVKPSTQYISTSGSEQVAFYDSEKVFISGLASIPNAFTSPTSAKYIRVTVADSILSSYQLQEGSTRTAYETYGTKLPDSLIQRDKSRIITVKADGSGDFTNLRSALASIAGAAESSVFTVNIYEGIYDIMSYYTESEINATSFIGLVIPNYVNLVGIGDRNKVILKGELAETFSHDTIVRVSTLCTFGNVGLKNLTVTAKNLRYAVHDDYPYVDYMRLVENCKFIHFAGIDGYSQAWGEGCRSGSRYEFKECEFYTERNAAAYSTHNNVSYAKPTYHRFENCKFSNLSGQYGIRFGSMGSGQREVVEIIGCRISGDLNLMEEVAGSGVGIDFDVSGYGNDVVPYNITTASGNQYTYNFIGETKEIKNVSAATILKGTPVKMKADYTGVEPMAPGDSPLLFYGIAFKDIAAAETGVIKISGYVKISDTGLTGLSVGDKIGISSGSLTVVTSGDYAGIVTLTNYIKLLR